MSRDPFLDNWYANRSVGLGEREDAPFRCLVPIKSQSFGDYLCGIWFGAKIAARFRHSLTHFIVIEETSYQRDLMEFFPYPFQTRFVDNSETFKDVLRDAALSDYDFVVPSGYTADRFAATMGSGHLVVPENIRAPADATLRDLGLDPEMWFCCMHFRQPNYQYKKTTNSRDSIPGPYLRSVDYVIDALGGQVVLLGHPEMETLPARKGFVDLSRISDSHALQMAAVARSRFGYLGPSGAMGMSSSLGVPTGAINVTDFFSAGIQASISHTLITPSGDRLSGDALYRSGLMNTRRVDELIGTGENYRVEQCGEDDFRRLLNYMVEETTDTPTWRPYRSAAMDGSGVFSWPPPISMGHNFI